MPDSAAPTDLAIPPDLLPADGRFGSGPSKIRVEALDALHAARPIAFIAYAEDALRWHHGEGTPALAEDLRRLSAWRWKNNLRLEDVLRVIREQEEPA